MTDSQQQAAVHLANAQHYLLISQWARARDAATRSLAVEPENADAHAVLSIALGALGEKEAALREAELAIQYGPNDYYSYYARGKVAAMSRHWAEAERYFRQALMCDSDISHLRQDIAETLFYQDQLDQAWALQQQVLANSPDKPKSHLLAAKIATRREDNQAAERHLVRTLQLDPENAEAQRLYAYAQVENENIAAGTETLREALRLDPTNKRAQQFLKYIERLQHPFLQSFFMAEIIRLETGNVKFFTIATVTGVFAFTARYSSPSHPLAVVLTVGTCFWLSLFAVYWCLCALWFYPSTPFVFSWWKRILNGFGVIFFLLLPGAYWLVPKL